MVTYNSYAGKPAPADPAGEVEAEDGLGSCKLGVSDNSGYLRVPLKGSIRVWSLRNLGVPYFGGPYNKDPTI